MPLTENIRALEKAAEKQTLIFFTWLGAGVAPESWQQEALDEFNESDTDKNDEGNEDAH